MSHRLCLLVIGCAVGLLGGAAQAVGGDLHGSTPPATRVSRGAGQDLGLDRIRLSLIRSLEGQLRDHEGELRVRVVQPDAPVRVPAGRMDVQILSDVADIELGRSSFQVSVTVDGRRVQVVDVVADIEVWADLVTPLRGIQADETIAAEDVGLQRVSLPSLSHDFARTPEEVVGRRAARALRAQAPIRVAALGHAYAVKKGDHVTIEARRGGLTITASGVTKGVARVGQNVSVTNQDSGKEIRAKVVGPGIVRVDF